MSDDELFAQVERLCAECRGSYVLGRDLKGEPRATINLRVRRVIGRGDTSRLALHDALQRAQERPQ